MNKKMKGALGLLAVLAITVGFCFLGVHGAKDIKLGLDLNGGVSITYQTTEDNPTSEQMSDTVYKLQLKAQGYSTEAQVYQEGSNRINIDIPVRPMQTKSSRSSVSRVHSSLQIRRVRYS